MDYKNSKIYKIESHLGDKVYIGSTTKQYLSQRMSKHRTNYAYWKKNKDKTSFMSSFILFDEYGVENCSCVLIETCPCNSKDELRAREAHIIKTTNCINKNIPFGNRELYRKEYREKNRDHKLETDRLYREAHREELNKQKIEKITCICGSIHTRSNKSKHVKSIKHLNYLSEVKPSD